MGNPIEPKATRMIVADDSKVFRREVVKGIQRRLSDIDIDEVESGAELVAKVRDDNYFFVLTDNRMPQMTESQMTGVEATREIRKFDEDIPICVMSLGEIASVAMEAGATYFVNKVDIDLDELAGMIEGYM